MGILKEYHNKGIGKKLVERAVSYSLENSYKFLMVKTLGKLILIRTIKRPENSLWKSRILSYRGN